MWKTSWSAIVKLAPQAWKALVTAAEPAWWFQKKPAWKVTKRREE